MYVPEVMPERPGVSVCGQDVFYPSPDGMRLEATGRLLRGGLVGRPLWFSSKLEAFGLLFYFFHKEIKCPGSNVGNILD